MGKIEKTIFLSYRRTNLPWALAIFQNLRRRRYNVFFDYEGIGPGDFEQIILENIKSHAHFLVILTPSALERCTDPADWLRREIETALESKRNIVPLMLEGFDFGTPAIANQLTGKLGALKHYNPLSIPPEYFLEAMGKLRDRFLNVPLTAVLHPASLPAQQAANAQKTAAEAALAVPQDELTAHQWFERGFNAPDLDEKVLFYSNAIRLKPKYGDAHFNRGLARLTKGDSAGAIQDFDEVIRLQPDDSEAFYNRGKSRSEVGDLAGAIQDYDEAIRLKPDYSQAYYSRGNARSQDGDLKGAIQDYDEANRLDPDDASAYNNRGIARRANHDLDGALQDFNEAIRLKPGHAGAFNNRGIVRAQKHDPDGAIKDYDEAIRLKPDHAEAFYNRGNARSAKGDFKAAAQDFAEAARLQRRKSAT